MSDHAKEWIEYITKYHEFLTCFKYKVFSFETSVLKSEPESFEYLIQTYNLNPEECIFIDDNFNNILIAKSIGFNTLHFKNRAKLVRDLIKYGVAL